ncbi:hypothetical protein ABT299_44935 [Spirillospora sp. NPDC000708]
MSKGDADERRALAEICRDAVKRWFARLGVLALAVALAAAAARVRYSARPPRPASSDGRMVLPGMRRATWYRTARLVEARAVAEFGQARPGPKPKAAAAPTTAQEAEARVADEAAAEWRRAFTGKPVRQMIGMLGDYADDAGRIANAGRFLACYRKAFQCSQAAAYAHWRTVRELGLVRQTRHSAGHRGATGPAGAADRCARYVLCWPSALLPDALPAEADAKTAGPLAAAAAQWDAHAGEALAAADDLVLYRYGAATTTQDTGPDELAARAEPAAPVDNPNRPSLYYLEAWPLYARVSPPSPPHPPIRRGDRPLSRRPGGLNDYDRAAARAILNRCRDHWASQGQQLSEEEIAQLSGLVALVSRYTAHLSAGDLVDILTERVRSARDLAGLLRYRLQALLRDLRRRRNLPVDETGEHYADRLDRARKVPVAESIAQHEAAADSRAEMRAELDAARARIAARQAKRRMAAEQARAAHWPRWCPPPRRPATEAEDVLGAELIARGIVPAPRRPGAVESPEEFAAELAAQGITPEDELAAEAVTPWTSHSMSPLFQAVVNANASAEQQAHRQAARDLPPLAEALGELDHLPETHRPR